MADAYMINATPAIHKRVRIGTAFATSNSSACAIATATFERAPIGTAFANSNSSVCAIATANFERAPHFVPTMVRIPSAA